MPAKPLVKPFPAGTQFVRVYDTSATYGKLSFNPSRASATNKKEGSRFDATKGVAEEGDVYYVAHPDSATQVAFWETQQNNIEWETGRKKRLLFRSKLRNKAFLKVGLTKDVVLTDILDVDGASRIGASIKVLQGNNRLRTRKWARYIRRHLPGHHGLFYFSSAVGSERHGHAVVLFKPACDESFLTEVGSPVPLDRGEGLKIVKQALRDSGIGLGPG